MKIVQVANTLAASDGGPARNSFELNVTLNTIPETQSQLFFMNGDRADSVLAAYDGAAGPLPIPGPLRVALWGSTKRGHTTLFRALHKLRNADVVIIHGYFLFWIPLLAALLKAFRVPFVITPHGALTDHQRRAGRRKKALYEFAAGRWVRSWAAGFVTGSDAEAKELGKVFPDSQVEVGGVGTVMPEVFFSDNSWGATPKLLSLSRIAAKKRIDISLDTVALLQSEGLEVEMDVVGDGDEILLANLVAKADKLGISNRVEFHGLVVGHDKRRYYNDADIYLLPSDDENFGISLAEALSYGVPSIASANVASAKAITGRAGSVVSSPTPESMAGAIRKILNGERSVARQSARLCAEANFSWWSAGNLWIGALNHLLRCDSTKGGRS